MRKRCGLLLLVSLATGLSGCAATKMGDGTPTYGPQAWSQAPAPPQKTVATTVPTAQPSPFDEPTSTPKPVGLAKYFPGLQRTQPDPPKVATRYRPTWFGLRPNPDANKPAQPTTYMTDARVGLSRPLYAPEPASLPVALQAPVPISTNDGAVKTTNAEQSVPGSNANQAPTPTPASAPPVLDPSASNNVSSNVPDSGDKPSSPGEGEVNPLPPELGSNSPSIKVVDQMPADPVVAPSESPKLGKPEPAQSASVTQATPVPNAPSDIKAIKAITPATNPTLPPGVPDTTVPASYASIVVAQEAVGFKKLSDCKVFASPQSAPAPTPQSCSKPAPAPQVKPTSQAVPTSLSSKPSPQASPSSQTCATAPAATTWQRPCLRRLIRKCCGLGEFADPPTAAPH
jgi:hypothetical protein